MELWGGGGGGSSRVTSGSGWMVASAGSSRGAPDLARMELNSLGSSGWSAVHLAALTSLWRCLQPALDLLVPQGRRGSACPQALPLPELDPGGAPGRVSGLVSSCNPAGRNYKLDLHALYISKAVQFKQAAASTNIDEVCGWVHLCCRLVDKAQQAAHLAPLQP
ncbi:hypothetical protein HaLaN_31071, partial [Haematococcus lacustris]